MSYIGFDIFFLSRYRIAIFCFFVSFQTLIAQCYSVMSTSFFFLFSEFSLSSTATITETATVIAKRMATNFHLDLAGRFMIVTKIFTF